MKRRMNLSADTTFLGKSTEPEKIVKKIFTIFLEGIMTQPTWEPIESMYHDLPKLVEQCVVNLSDQKLKNRVRLFLGKIGNNPEQLRRIKFNEEERTILCKRTTEPTWATRLKKSVHPALADQAQASDISNNYRDNCETNNQEMKDYSYWME